MNLPFSCTRLNRSGTLPGYFILSLFLHIAFINTAFMSTAVAKTEPAAVPLTSESLQTVLRDIHTSFANRQLEQVYSYFTDTAVVELTFLADEPHTVRSPIAMIQAFTSRRENIHYPGYMYEIDAEHIEISADGCHATIREALFLTKGEQGKSILVRADVSFVSLNGQALIEKIHFSTGDKLFHKQGAAL